MSYWTFIILTLAIGAIATWRVNSALKKYSKVASASGFTGAQMAHAMLSAHGVSGVRVYSGAEGQDHFDPRSNSISLSPSVYNGRSITAMATACHEVGHACQFAQGYAPMKIRGALVPAVNLASNAWIFLLMLGIFLYVNELVLLAIVMYAAVVLFQLVTLPVEFDASRRAMKYLTNAGAAQVELTASSKVLRACAFTYMAAALTSILQLLWLLGQRQE